MGRVLVADKTVPKQLTPWKAGQSGNPKGRPKGARNKATMAIEALLDGEAEALTRKAIELALAGDMAALRLCIERLVPPRKDRPIAFDMPPITSLDDAVNVATSVLHAVAGGDLTPNEAEGVCRVLSDCTSILTAADFEERLSTLEEATK